MSENRPILTFQIGHYSNFVGTHWWNLQDSTFEFDPLCASRVEVDHDVFFRQGLSPQGEITYTPRLIAFDLKGSLGSFSNQESVNVKAESSSLWQESSEIQRTEPEVKNAFLQHLEDANTNDTSSTPFEMENIVKVWSDYLKVKLHPKSIHLLTGHFHNNTLEPFDSFSQGISYWNKEERRDEIEDLIRWYIEDCDYLQGFNMMLDAENGFSGLAGQILQHLSEEYPRKTRFAFPLLPAMRLKDPSHVDYDNERNARLINTGFGLDYVFEHSSVFSPLTVDSSWGSRGVRKFQNFQYESSLPYHTSAILATALETITMPLRKKSGSSPTLQDLEQSLVHLGRKGLSVSCAFPLLRDASGERSLNSLTSELVPLTPGIESVKDAYAQSLVWRGIGDGEKSQNIIDEWSSQQWEAALTENTLFHSLCPGETPFPQFFSKPQEELAAKYLKHITGTSQFRAVAGLHSSPSFGKSIQQLLYGISRIHLKKLHRFTSLGVEEEDLTENRHKLMEYAECYQDHQDF